MNVIDMRGHDDAVIRETSDKALWLFAAARLC